MMIYNNLLCRFRTPLFTTERRFPGTSQFGDLWAFLENEGFKRSDYKLLVTWPKKDVRIN